MLLGKRTIALLALCFLSGCASTDTVYPLTGAGAGAAAGGLIGAATGDATTSIIGAAIGAPVGGLLGSWFSGSQRKTREKEYSRGYDRGRSDAIKSQYWMAQRLQEGDARPSQYRTTYYTLPVNPRADQSPKTVPYEVTVPILEPR